MRRAVIEAERSAPPSAWPGEWPRPPAPDEFAAFYQGYVQHAAAGGVWHLLERQAPLLAEGLSHLDDAAARLPYAPGKWSVKEVVGHLADSERIFAYRALRIARGDRTPLPGFDQDAYVAAGAFSERELSGLLEEFAAVRSASLTLLGGFGPEEWARRGVASEAPVSVGALAYVMAGHVEHHIGILRERYGIGSLPSG